LASLPFLYCFGIQSCLFLNSVLIGCVVLFCTGDDDVEGNAKLCPGLATEQARFNTEMGVLSTKGFDLMKKVLSVSGVPYTVDNMGLARAQDCYFTHICPGFPVADPVFQEAAEEAAQWYFKGQEFGDIAPMTIGPLLRELLTTMQNVKNRLTHERLYLVAGHDTGPILPMLIAFDMFDGKWSPYASMINMELYEVEGAEEEDSQWVVRFVYNTKVLKPKACMKQWCTFSEFTAIGKFLYLL